MQQVHDHPCWWGQASLRTKDEEVKSLKNMYGEKLWAKDILEYMYTHTSWWFGILEADDKTKSVIVFIIVDNGNGMHDVFWLVKYNNDDRHMTYIIMPIWLDQLCTHHETDLQVQPSSDILSIYIYIYSQKHILTYIQPFFHIKILMSTYDADIIFFFNYYYGLEIYWFDEEKRKKENKKRKEKGEKLSNVLYARLYCRASSCTIHMIIVRALGV